MNICMICPEIGNSGGNAFIGGHSNNVVQLSKELCNRGHNVTLITTPHRHSGNQPDTDILDGIKIVSLPISSSFSSIKYGLKFAIGASKTIKKINNREQFDIIHGHSGYTMPALITGFSSKITKVPSVHTIYSPIKPLANNFNFCRMFSNNTLSKIFLDFNRIIITLSKNIETSLVNAEIACEKIKTVPPGINTKVFNPFITHEDIRKKYGINSNQPVLSYVGSLTRIKGISVLIDALGIVVKTNPNVRLFMILNMPVEMYLEPNNVDMDMELIFKIKQKIKEKNLENVIIPVGIINNIAQYLAASDTFVLPFLNTVGVADYPLSMLEAMAVETPVIATNIGGIPELIKNNQTGLLVEPNNVQELANSIIYSIKNKEEIADMGRNGRQIIQDKLSIEATVNSTEQIYKEIITKGV